MGGGEGVEAADPTDDTESGDEVSEGGLRPLRRACARPRSRWLIVCVVEEAARCGACYYNMVFPWFFQYLNTPCISIKKLSNKKSRPWLWIS